MTIDIDAIRQREKAATPGPWQRREWQVRSFGGHIAECMNDEGDACRHDAEFIAHARTDIPALLAEIERLRAAHDSAIEAIAEAESDIDDRDSEISTLKHDLDFQTKAAWDNRSEIERLRAQVAELTAERDAARAEAANALRAVDKANTQIAGREKNINHQHAEITRLRLHVDGLESQLAAQQPVINAARAWVDSSPADFGRTNDALIAAVDALPKTEATTADQYLIWSNHHQTWFASNGRGYRRNPADAGRYTLDDAQKWLGRSCDCCQVPEVLVRADAVIGVGDDQMRAAIAEATKAAIEAGQGNKHFQPAEVAS